MITSSTVLQTKYGNFTISYHKEVINSHEDCCVSISSGRLSKKGCLVRIHSSCLFGESLNAIDCDCSLQLEKTMKLIGKEEGVIIYLYQEGRGVGLENKIKAMEIERVENTDTVEAFKKLDFALDARDYKMAILALKDLRVNSKIRLITNNPRKKAQLEKNGFMVTELVKLQYPVNSLVSKYLQVKKNKLGHLL